MIEPMPCCPYGPKRDKGAHDLSFFVPDDYDEPVTAICDKCGLTFQRAIGWAKPLDDLSAEAIAELTRRVV